MAADKAAIVITVRMGTRCFQTAQLHSKSTQLLASL
jgi:hypothetical protein